MSVSDYQMGPAAANIIANQLNKFNIRFVSGCSVGRTVAAANYSP